MTNQITTPADPGYCVRFASLRDLRALHRLERAVFSAADSYNYIELLTLLMWPGMVNLKAVALDGALVGYVCGGRLFGIGHTWIVTIGVHPDHQGRGLGRWLLESCEALLRDPVIYLTVRDSNERALTLYLRSGYRRVRSKPGYYPDGETGIEMRKDREPRRR